MYGQVYFVLLNHTVMDVCSIKVFESLVIPYHETVQHWGLVSQHSLMLI